MFFSVNVFVCFYMWLLLFKLIVMSILLRCAFYGYKKLPADLFNPAGSVGAATE